MTDVLENNAATSALVEDILSWNAIKLFNIR